MKIYIASKIKHAERWKDLRLANSGSDIEISSSWIDKGDISDQPNEVLHTLWEKNLYEASTCDFLIWYHEEGETPQGSLVELGAALTAGIPSFMVTKDPLWQNKTLWKSGVTGQATSMDDVLAYIQEVIDGKAD